MLFLLVLWASSIVQCSKNTMTCEVTCGANVHDSCLCRFSLSPAIRFTGPKVLAVNPAATHYRNSLYVRFSFTRFGYSANSYQLTIQLFTSCFAVRL